MRLKSLLVLLPMLIVLPISTVQAEAYPSTYSPLPSSPNADYPRNHPDRYR